jgi:membrane protease YdiL (CAAX protease family)
MHRPSPVVLGSLSVICGYVLIRGCVYHFFPITSLESWFFRDTLMSLPRFGAFTTLLLLNRSWNASRFDLLPKDFGRAVLMGFVPTALWILYFSGSQGETYPPFMKFVGFFTSLIVGAFEEYAFRGPLLSALCQQLSVFTATILGSVLFTVYHFQAQSFQAWIAIFLTGVIYANLRLRGLGLGWLALIHGITDASLFMFPSQNPALFGLYGLTFQGGLLIYAVATFPRSKAALAQVNLGS